MAGYVDGRNQLATTIILILFSSSLAHANDVDVAEIFNQWIVQHQRVYSTEVHKQNRFEIFKANWEYVENFKKIGNKTYTLGLNKFSDLSPEEFLETYSCGTDSTPISTHSNSTSTYPHVGMDYLDYESCYESRDWTKDGYVSPPGYQTPYCGSCWAFTTAATVEGIAYIKRNISVQLSVQQIVDCDKWSNQGCIGGVVTDAFDYVKRNGGLTSADNYPYDAKNGMCNLDKAKQFKASITGFARVPPNDEYELEMAVCQQPVAVSIQTTGEFHLYSGGVFSKDCGNKERNHAMAIVGMGETDEGVMYWKLKNSWGQDWGEGGYMRMIRGTNKPEGELELPLVALLMVIVAPYQVMSVRGKQEGAIISLAIAAYMAYQHFSRTGSLNQSFNQGSIVATLAILCIAVMSCFLLFGVYCKVIKR